MCRSQSLPMTPAVMRRGAWLLIWSRNACPVFLDIVAKEVCRPSLSTLDVSSATILPPVCANGPGLHRWARSASLGPVCIGAQACLLSDNARNGQCPHLRCASPLQHARCRVQCGTSGHHIIDQQHGTVSTRGVGTDGKSAGQIALAGLA